MRRRGKSEGRSRKPSLSQFFHREFLVADHENYELAPGIGFERILNRHETYWRGRRDRSVTIIRHNLHPKTAKHWCCSARRDPVCRSLRLLWRFLGHTLQKAKRNQWQN